MKRHLNSTLMKSEPKRCVFHFSLSICSSRQMRQGLLFAAIVSMRSMGRASLGCRDGTTLTQLTFSVETFRNRKDRERPGKNLTQLCQKQMRKSKPDRVTWPKLTWVTRSQEYLCTLSVVGHNGNCIPKLEPRTS